MKATAPLDALIGYLAACGGCDRFEFHDTQGAPDPSAARGFAEKLRAKLGDSVGISFTVEQVANRVTVCVLTEHAEV
jgi:hypothetical protein